jgi:hypothetical protein
MKLASSGALDAIPALNIAAKAPVSATGQSSGDRIAVGDGYTFGSGAEKNRDRSEAGQAPTDSV